MNFIRKLFSYRYNNIFCRTGITDQLPYGDDWYHLPGNFTFVSCGDYGCWAIKPDNSIAFRTGVTITYPQGTNWLDVDGKHFVQLEAGYQDDGMCNVVRVIEFEGTRLKSGEIETYCNMGKVKCFFRCLNTNGCQSFAVGLNTNCTGTFCLLYSLSEINMLSYFLKDSNSTYYFMVGYFDKIIYGTINKFSK
ncbi:Hypothetical predicted protein [Paramuricea clavata]|uniref:Uncharacterized protein n=1 Tax=Paramuricea clavata TaxID=317549 RepID=A0A7D9LY49_PARCT|nr:Hypothetical predicted protein [Paramuricea clavata]